VSFADHVRVWSRFLSVNLFLWMLIGLVAGLLLDCVAAALRGGSVRSGPS
jgi:hypothetical protein